MGTESNRCFGLIISGVGRGVEWGSDWGVALYPIKMYLACGLILKKKLLPLIIALVVILNHLRVNTFMTATKNDQFCDPLRPVPHPVPRSAKINNRSFV